MRRNNAGQVGNSGKIPGECNLFARDLVLLMNSERSGAEK